MTTKLLASCSAAAFLLSVGIAVADNNEYGDFDKNSDKNISMEEYGSGLDRLNLYARFDVNTDGHIDDNECKSGFKNNSDVCGNWTKWDANADGKVDKAEFNGGMYTTYNNDADTATMNQTEFDAGASVYTSN